MKLWWHKVKNWEYWSVYVVYMPVFFLWLWNMLKFRSFSFFKYANPGIKNGGFYGDSKAEIYKLLPQTSYPKTVLVETNKPTDFFKLIKDNQLKFPLIVKPDIGCRGVGVQKVNVVEEIMLYGQSLQANFLIQETVDYPNEIGLFYCRLPNENKGKITGITLKQFLTVEGNGKENIKQLLQKVPRFEMQIPKLMEQINLNEVPALGEKRCLVPFGNHNRGTKFLDGKKYITEKLENTFNAILANIPGFYYGRLDIRFNTFEELELGLHFSIIELNGAKSEPTHIYDPKYTFWKAQLEIFRHQNIFQKIIHMNAGISQS